MSTVLAARREATPGRGPTQCTLATCGQATRARQARGYCHVPRAPQRGGAPRSSTGKRGRPDQYGK
eukprot:587339-Alexandrium_andersonii.AAC.1